MQRNLAALIVLAIVVGGCGGNDPFGPNRPRRGPATQLGGQLAPVDDEGRPVGRQPAPPPPPAAPPQAGSTVAPPPPPPPPNTNPVREEAHAGVTGKGNYGGGLITTPVSAYFSIRERIVFNIQIPDALNKYKAFEGHAPKTHEEFMEGVIKANSISLPELPPDHRYVFDPATQELMVERPE